MPHKYKRMDWYVNPDCAIWATKRVTFAWWTGKGERLNLWQKLTYRLDAEWYTATVDGASALSKYRWTAASSSVSSNPAVGWVADPSTLSVSVSGRPVGPKKKTNQHYYGTRHPLLCSMSQVRAPHYHQIDIRPCKNIYSAGDYELLDSPMTASAEIPPLPCCQCENKSK